MGGVRSYGQGTTQEKQRSRRHHAWEEFVATVREQHKKSKEAEDPVEEAGEGRAASPAAAAAAATFIMNNWRHLIPHLSTTNA